MVVLRFLRRLPAAVSLAAVVVVSPAQAQETIEKEVKAAFLYNFTRFIVWPDGLPRGSEPFRLCVVAEQAMTKAVEQTVAGETVNGRPLQAVVPRTSEQAKSCQILFVGRGELREASRLLSAVRDLPVLTVSDAPGFAAQGGAIEFALENRRVRFEINLQATDRAKLKPGANLIQVARRVHGVRR